ncbi:MAG TPA: hypothetical protein EYG30_02925 [Planctomycetes bacterium]|nr:hypothetical protein [Planctomycetota bacterium]HIL51196.1 hypothetical protein [Planctomycetota bacterium]
MIPMTSWTGVMRLGALLFLAGCGEELPVESVEPAESAEPVSELDRLRALGYAGLSSETVGEGLSGVLVFDQARSQPGYNLYSVRLLCRVVLMNAVGQEVRRWERPQDRAWSHAQLVDNGDLLVIGQEHSRPYLGAVDEHRYLLRLSWNGEELWKVDLNAHHDLEVAPGGEICVLSFARTLGSELTEEGVELREDELLLLNSEGERIGRRSLVTALSGGVYEWGAVRPNESGGVRYLDLIHANSLEFLQRAELFGRGDMYAEGCVLVTARHQDCVLVMDWESGELIWSWGHGELLGPHGASWLASGNLLIFDNGLSRGWSRVIELDPRTEQIVWEYKSDFPEDFYSPSRGSCQRLANGNTLVAASTSGRAFEITPGGEIVWSWINPAREEGGQVATVVRMTRLDLDFVDRLRGGR